MKYVFDTMLTFIECWKGWLIRVLWWKKFLTKVDVDRVIEFFQTFALVKCIYRIMTLFFYKKKLNIEIGGSARETERGKKIKLKKIFSL